MSYILDALKKNQAEQAGDGVTLRVQSNRTSSASRGVLVYILATVVLVNLGLLGWIFKDELHRNTPAQPTNVPPASAANEVLKNDLEAATKRPPPDPTNQPNATPTAGSAAKTTSPAAMPRSTTGTPATVQPPSASSSAPNVAAARPGKAESTRTPIALAALPAGEQIIYREFNYSSHIYTDDPSLCAIVIDGQRLKAGDAFKGLKIHAITEAGVIFDETRRGVSRLIEVSIFELWNT